MKIEMGKEEERKGNSVKGASRALFCDLFLSFTFSFLLCDKQQ